LANGPGGESGEFVIADFGDGFRTAECGHLCRLGFDVLNSL
jgi:hypothetical protein